MTEKGWVGKMSNYIEINGRRVGAGYPVYVVAEMSANHHQNFEQAVRVIKAAKKAGADAIKLQTYTPDTMTINCRNEYFTIQGTIWNGRTLYDLYKEAFTPWDWQPKLKAVADELGIDFFSTPFDGTAVAFLEAMAVPVYKIASFENVDLPLLRKVAGTGKPIIMSTGMATASELDEAVRAIREAGGSQLALLKCTSSYPCLPQDMNLRTLPILSELFGVPVGLSDHSLDATVPVIAVSLGACIIEKHFTLSRAERGPDSDFSLEPQEFKSLVDAVRTTEKALGEVKFGTGGSESDSRIFRRSIFVVQDMRKGQAFTDENIRSIRPGFGLKPKYFEAVLGRYATCNIKTGTPLTWDLVGGKSK